ncbi:outer membrane biogenesis protein BamB [Planctomycetes bacterium Pan216]|uniref:Outer membrane biogenesis protein BamB n=1 Tax=Kolteria novifilia TaxID=2527975 RepID=A0A518AZ45_9BACT|nr:outer membrane biogenesis protein BamB [Planctomycetes bacterium Pan216]
MAFLLLLSSMLGADASANWPAFRGDGTSRTAVAALPLTWSENENLAWNTELPGYGQSSPVVWGNRAFVTSVSGPDKDVLHLTGVDVNSGKILWTKEFPGTLKIKSSDYVSRAAPTPVVDAHHVYALWGSGDLIAVDHEGNEVWKRSFPKEYGDFQGNHGIGASLALSSTGVVLLIDHSGPSYLMTADPKTGETIWKSDRPSKVSWSSPSIAKQKDGTEIVLVSSNGTVEAYKASDGSALWNLGGLDGNTVPSASISADKELVVVGSKNADSNLALRLGGTGDVTDSHVVWRSEQASSSFGSPLVHDDAVYLVNRSGVGFCLDLATGKERWHQRLGESCWASPIGAGDRVYFFTKNGKTLVAATGPEWKQLAENDLPTEDRVYGVAVVPGGFLVRTGSALTRVGTLAGKSAAK